jgi:hypothetical protein
MRLRRKNTARIRVRVWIPLSRGFIAAKDSIKWEMGSGKWKDGCKIEEVASDE